MMLINSKAEADNSDQKNGRDAAIALVKKSGVGAVVEQMLPKMVCDATRKDQAEVVKALEEIMRSQPTATLEHALGAMRDREDSTDHVRSVAEPTLIIAGADDAIVPLKLAEGLHRETARSELCIISDAGHMSPMEQPAKVARAIGEFVARLG